VAKRSPISATAELLLDQSAAHLSEKKLEAAMAHRYKYRFLGFAANT